MERREKMERKKMKMKMKSEGMNGECEVRVYICGLTLGLTTNVMQFNPKCHVNEGDFRVKIRPRWDFYGYVSV